MQYKQVVHCTDINMYRKIGSTDKLKINMLEFPFNTF